MSEPVIVGVYSDLMSAHLARTQLEHAGMMVFLIDEHLLTYDPWLSGAVGGIKVAVMPNEAEAAVAILRREIQRKRKPVTCPKCSSKKTEVHSIGRTAAWLTILFLGFPIGRSRQKNFCSECKHTWRG